jgi:hypothetical protein
VKGVSTMHQIPNVYATLVEVRRQACPCGAATDQPGTLCRKCHSRMVWRRRNEQPVRHRGHHRLGRQARGRQRIIDLAAALSGAGERTAR